MTQVFETFAGRLETPAARTEALRRGQGVLRHALSTLGFAAIWGVAAGAGSPALALANLYKVPMVITLSTLVALPAILTTRHLLNLESSPLDLLAVLCKSLYRAGLVLLSFAPLLAVYAYTSQWFSPLLAQISGGLAILCAALSLYSGLSKLEGNRTRLLALTAVSALTLGLALLQLIAIATPILSVPTMFGRGIDGVVSQ
jgi:hypothetical protein